MKSQKKKAPAGPTAKGQRAIPVSYRKLAILSTAAEILFVLMQAPDHADRLRQSCWRSLESILRRHYEESGAGA